MAQYELNEREGTETGGAPQDQGVWADFAFIDTTRLTFGVAMQMMA